MVNPVAIEQELKKEYLAYLDSGIKLKYRSAIDERRSLFSKSNLLMQSPFIEVIQKYVGEISLSQLCHNLDINNGFADFINSGLFYNEKIDEDSSERLLYGHQVRAFIEAVKNKKNVVVTTGTGSGKTECFLLPMC